MENIYTLTGKFAEANAEYDELQALLDEIYTENGGEVTEETEEMEAIKEQLASLKESVLKDIFENADGYAAIAKNKEAQRKVLEAEMKAVKEEQRKVLDRYQARINRLQRSIDFWKENFDAAMKMEACEKIGGPKTDHKFTIYYQTVKSIQVNEAIALAPYQGIVENAVKLLPAWAKLGVTIDKNELKKVEELPAGAERVESKNIQIR